MRPYRLPVSLTPIRFLLRFQRLRQVTHFLKTRRCLPDHTLRPLLNTSNNISSSSNYSCSNNNRLLTQAPLKVPILQLSLKHTWACRLVRHLRPQPIHQWDRRPSLACTTVRFDSLRFRPVLRSRRQPSRGSSSRCNPRSMGSLQMLLRPPKWQDRPLARRSNSLHRADRHSSPGDLR